MRKIEILNLECKLLQTSQDKSSIVFLFFFRPSNKSHFYGLHHSSFNHIPPLFLNPPLPYVAAKVQLCLGE